MAQKYRPGERCACMAHVSLIFFNKTEINCLLLNILYEYKDKYKVHIDISIGRVL